MKKQPITFSNYSKSIAHVNLKQLPKVLQQGHHFFMEASDFYHQEPEIKETIDLYLDQLNTQLFTETKDSSKDESLVSISFIRSFLKMHQMTLHKDELKMYIFDLQRAITKKEITKDDPYANQIEEIQQKLIVHYNNLILEEKIKISINRKWRWQLQKITKDKVVATLQGLDTRIEIKNRNSSIPKTATSNLFTPINSQPVVSLKNTFRLQGGLGELLGDLEKFELALTIEGDQGGGKTRFTYQLADAFADIGNRTAIFSLEIGQRSDLITRMKESYLQASNQNHIFITDQLPEGFETISKAAKDFDVIIIDSWNKTGLPSQDFDRLRKQHPDTIFIVIFQRTTQKTIRGGTAPLFDAGINIEVIKADDTFQNNYAITTKNRYGITGIKYNIFSKEIIGTPALVS